MYVNVNFFRVVIFEETLFYIKTKILILYINYYNIIYTKVQVMILCDKVNMRYIKCSNVYYYIIIYYAYYDEYKYTYVILVCVVKL